MEFDIGEDSPPENRERATVADNGLEDRFYDFFGKSPAPAVRVSCYVDTPSTSRKSGGQKQRGARISDASTTAPSGVSPGLSSLSSPMLLAGPTYKQRRNRRRKERRKNEKREQQAVVDSMSQDPGNRSADHLTTAQQLIVESCSVPKDIQDAGY